MQNYPKKLLVIIAEAALEQVLSTARRAAPASTSMRARRDGAERAIPSA
ncbi:MAG TPA: hypothetical protein VIS73_00810 [Rhodocyclaceae bacterium]